MQPVPAGPGSPAAAMDDVMVTARAVALVFASAAQAMVAPSVPSVVMATTRPRGTRATSYVPVGGSPAWRGAGLCCRGSGPVLPWCGQLPPACAHTCCALPPECYRACGRCTGPEDSSCLRCKRGWVLHEHRCIGERHSGRAQGCGELCPRSWGSTGPPPRFPPRHRRVWHRDGALPS